MSTTPARVYAPFRLVSFPSTTIAVLPVAVAIVVALLLSRPRVLPLTGDEPHYLVMADSLISDFTLDLRGSYARESRTGRIYGAPLNSHVVIVNHRWGPYHAPGLSILLAFPFLLGDATGAKLALCLLAGLLPLTLFDWLRRLMPVFPAAWLTAGLTVSLPIVFGSSQIYPDLPAGVVAMALTLWLLQRSRDDLASGAWASYWLVSGLLPWLNVKFLVTTAVLALGGLGAMWRMRRAGRRDAVRSALATCALVAVGPAALAAYHVWAFGTPAGPRGAAELTTSLSRALMMFLGLHLDQGQGMFFQHPLLLGGVAAFLPFARLRPRVALFWLALYASLIVPNSFELARFGGGGPAGRFGWSAEWLWIVPLGFVIAEYREVLARYVKPAVIACVVYQAALAVRWLPNPQVLFLELDERIWARNSLFPIQMRNALPSFYFWDFSSYWTYLPNVLAYVGVGVLLASGALIRTRRNIHLP